MSSNKEFRLDYEGFRSAEISSDKITGKLLHAKNNAIFTGIKVMDDVFGGILPNDIILFGSKTGTGKTAMASEVALYNCIKNRRVYMYALEAEEDEIQMRIIFEKVAEKVKAFNPRRKINYKHWKLGRYEDLNHYYQDCLRELNDFENLFIYYRKKEFGIEQFVKTVMEVKEDADLIIIDHIHYFDLQGTNRNDALGDAIKKIRDISLLMGVPIIILAHLRKAQGSDFKLMPTIDDFHGSSDLTKICTKGVIMAPGKQQNDMSETLFHFPKFRGFSTPSRYLFKCDYNIYLNKYSPTYTIHKFRMNKRDFNFPDTLVDPAELTWLG